MGWESGILAGTSRDGWCDVKRHFGGDFVILQLEVAASSGPDARISWAR